jgi:hypothetical protein
MQINANIEELKDDINRRICFEKRRIDRDRRESLLFAVYLGVVSAITTVCIGIGKFLPGSNNIFGIVSLIASASVTVISAWDGIFHFKKIWISSDMTHKELLDLDMDIRHSEKSSSGITQDQANQFYSRFKKIENDNNERYHRIRD